MAKLVIVESPTKAKTITKFLGSEYKVLSSFGHIRDLPKSDLGVDLENDYTAKYVVPTTSRKHVKALKDAAKTADEVLFATDEDREGEAISWHLAEVLKIKPEKVKRIVFHEITKKAIEHALENPRELDMHLVDAQQARRILDRLYGYEISPILWRKVAPKLSAGRVQSVATRVIVERERERMHFVHSAFWDILGNFTKDEHAVETKLIEINGKKIAIGKHFDPMSGELDDDAKKKEVILLDEKTAKEYVSTWKNDEWKVESVEQKPITSKPPAPFTTSTLQQEAARKLGLSSKDTMRTAQSLYEHGYITYMRTDSTLLSEQALKAAREVIESDFGKEFLPETANQHKTKVKNAQEAHEAIRPSGDIFTSPKDIGSKVSSGEAALYELIWQRTIASQMLPAKLQQTTIHITNGVGVFTTSGKVIEFAGYMRAYVEDSDDPEAELEHKEKTLPPLKEGDALNCKSLEAQSHETKPPARYTEASLIKFLEANGIGRPSTFASIIGTIIYREYVHKDGKALTPTWKAFAVVQLLEQNFSHLVDTSFTAEMEDSLDHISRGEKEMVPFLNAFYLGDKEKGLKEMLGGDIDARKAATVNIGESDGKAVNLRVGRYGPFIEFGELTANVPEDLVPDSLTVELALEMVLEQSKPPEPLGVDPTTEKNVYLLTGRYGPYVQLGDRDPEDKKVKPKMKSLLPGMTVEEVDLKVALAILSLPREIGIYEKTGEPVVVDLGRFGPYLKCGTETRSIPADEKLLEVTIERATELLNEEKKGRGRNAKKVLKELGVDKKKTIQLLDGKYGPYVSDGKLNASLPKDIKPEELTLKKALELLEERKK
ncbi:MAG: type I DNA topoisomerase [bacterium]|nr:type I DNA topoisomerase [bacterium]